jgi:PKD repeat protein
VFHADQREGFVPVTVQFLDASTGSPTGWSWSFGDGATSTLRNPVHVYDRAGSYTVSLAVANSLGSDVSTRTDLVHVEEPPDLLVLRAIADGTAYEGQPDQNYGGLELLRVRSGRDSDYRSFVKFFVPPSQGLVASAVVRLLCVDDSSGDNGLLHLVDDDWTEPTLTWNDMPAFGSSVGDLQDAQTGQSIDVDVSDVVTGSGTVSFGIGNTSYHSVYYSSREGESPPELRVTFSQAFSAGLEPRFEASRIRGSAPLTVQFFDTSNGRVDGWLWDFGDGSTSDVQNPSHTFHRPGLYAVSLTVRNANGEHTWTGPELVCVRPRDAVPLLEPVPLAHY